MRFKIRFAKRTTIYISSLACLSFIALAIVKLDLSVSTALQFLAGTAILLAGVIGIAALTAWLIRAIADRRG